MSRLRDGVRHRIGALLVVACASLAAATALATGPFPGIGRPATEREIAAWDIDVRPDFLGLPKGAGTVEQGQEIWEAKCASCHGTFGESNQVFTPLIGGTTAADIETGRVANLRRVDYPQRTTVMKAPYVATLFDYIRRAMPWNEPKSLSDDEVYAVLAFMLNLAEIVPDDFELSDANMATVQARMPNRDGVTTAHAMWPGGGLPGSSSAPDVGGTACMSDCAGEVAIASVLPDYARPAHGNLAAQHRRIGPVRGIVTGDDDPDAIDDPSPPALKRARPGTRRRSRASRSRKRSARSAPPRRATATRSRSSRRTLRRTVPWCRCRSSAVCRVPRRSCCSWKRTRTCWRASSMSAPTSSRTSRRASR